jgi:hypothetical protein
MTVSRDPERMILAFLREGEEQLHDQVYDAVRAAIDMKRQRAGIGSWRTSVMNRSVTVGLGAVAVVVIGLLLGYQLLNDSAEAGGLGTSPSATSEPAPSAQPGGTVEYTADGISTTTQVELVADGATLSGTAATTSSRGTHTVRVECFARDGDTWALGGTIEQSTLPSESAGAWSAVIVREGSPQRIGIWLSDPKRDGSDCEGWLAGLELADIDPQGNEGLFVPVESGTLVPPE